MKPISISEADLARLLQENAALSTQVTELQVAGTALVTRMRQFAKHEVDIRVKRVGRHALSEPSQLPPDHPVNQIPWPYMPRYQTAGSVGLDLYTTEPFFLTTGKRARLPTGIAIELPPGYKGAVLPRSGLSLKHGVLAITGSVDWDYRGEISVVVHNIGSEAYNIKAGDRIAQLVIVPVMRANLVEVDELSETKRGADGFGSTGDT